MKVHEIVLLIVVVTLGLVVWALYDSPLAQAKNGKLDVYCQTVDKGWHKIPPNKIIGNVDGRWYFTNGSATSCKTIAR